MAEGITELAVPVEVVSEVLVAVDDGAIEVLVPVEFTAAEGSPPSFCEARVCWVSGMSAESHTGRMTPLDGL